LDLLAGPAGGQTRTAKGVFEVGDLLLDVLDLSGFVLDLLALGVEVPAGILLQQRVVGIRRVLRLVLVELLLQDIKFALSHIEFLVQLGEARAPAGFVGRKSGGRRSACGGRGGLRFGSGRFASRAQLAGLDAVLTRLIFEIINLGGDILALLLQIRQLSLRRNCGGVLGKIESAITGATIQK